MIYTSLFLLWINSQLIIICFQKPAELSSSKTKIHIHIIIVMWFDALYHIENMIQEHKITWVACIKFDHEIWWSDHIKLIYSF